MINMPDMYMPVQRIHPVVGSEENKSLRRLSSLFWDDVMVEYAWSIWAELHNAKRYRDTVAGANSQNVHSIY